MPIATVRAWSDSEDGDGVGTPYMLLDGLKETYWSGMETFLS